MKLAHAVLGEIEALITGDFFGDAPAPVSIIVKAVEGVRQPGWNRCTASLSKPEDAAKIRDRHDAGN